jgi:hypothetical protein
MDASFSLCIGIGSSKRTQDAFEQVRTRRDAPLEIGDCPDSLDIVASPAPLLDGLATAVPRCPAPVNAKRPTGCGVG